MGNGMRQLLLLLQTAGIYVMKKVARREAKLLGGYVCYDTVILKLQGLLVLSLTSKVSSTTTSTTFKT